MLNALSDARNGLLTAPAEGILTGFAGDKLTGLLQRLPQVAKGDYLEVGVFQGSSLLSTALANPSIRCFGIDNYSQFDPSNRNRSIVVDRAERLGISNYELIDKDFEDGLLEFPGKVGTYFIDGPHDYRSQLVCLGYAPRFLERGGVMVVDDANYAHVRKATADFVTMFPEYKLVFEAYTRCHPINMRAEERAEAQAGWWNGVNVIVHDPDDQFDGLMPPAPSNSRFIRDHEIHGARNAPLSLEAADIIASLTSSPRHLPRALFRYLRGYKNKKKEIGEYRFCNTESSGLPSRTAKVRQ